MLVLFDRYDESFVDSLRDELLLDYKRFDGGMPSYLDLMARTVAPFESEIGISADQIQSYKTVSNFLFKDMRPKPSNTRFFHAYLELSNRQAALRCVSSMPLTERVKLYETEQIKKFRGRADIAYPSCGVDTFKYSARETDGTIFGVKWLEDYYEEVKWSDEGRTEIKERRQIDLWLVVHRQRNEKFDIAYALLINEHAAKLALDQVLSRAKSGGLKKACAFMSTDWLIRGASGLIFWDGLRFEGRLVSTTDRAPISISGVNYVIDAGPHFGGNPMSLDELLHEKNLDPYRLNEEVDICLYDNISLKYKNLRTGQENRPIKSIGKVGLYVPYFDPDLSLYAADDEEMREMDFRIKNGDGEHALPSGDTFEKIGPPIRSVYPPLKISKNRENKKVRLLLKIFAKYGKMENNIESPLYE